MKIAQVIEGRGERVFDIAEPEFAAQAGKVRKSRPASSVRHVTEISVVDAGSSGKFGNGDPLVFDVPAEDTSDPLTHTAIP